MLVSGETCIALYLSRDENVSFYSFVFSHFPFVPARPLFEQRKPALRSIGVENG